MIKIQKLVRPHMKRITPYASARNIYKGGDFELMDANENPFGMYNRYPDPTQDKLKAALSRIKKVPPEKIFLGNGSDEIIDLLIRLFCEPGQDKVLAFTPTYGMYKVCAEINNIKMIEEPLSSDFQISTPALHERFNDTSIKICFICSPNNPTGNSINGKDLKYILRTFKGVVVIDEAYIDFSSKASMIKYLQQYPQLVVLQTLSKAYGMAGLRIGMAYNHGEIIQLLNKIKAPYNISDVNQKQAIAILNAFKNNPSTKVIIRERKRLKSALSKNGSIKYIYPSEANFLLCKVNDASSIFQFLLDNGVVIRDRSNEIPNTVRISVGKPEANNKIIDLLKAYNETESTIS
ncbi:MAG: histidinol-phosphate transaminase [Saprospiraceae bacterium]|nr:histidinol-phosphate transaminase [Saprospiraceae bacterium]